MRKYFGRRFNIFFCCRFLIFSLYEKLQQRYKPDLVVASHFSTETLIRQAAVTELIHAFRSLTMWLSVFHIYTTHRYKYSQSFDLTSLLFRSTVAKCQSDIEFYSPILCQTYISTNSSLPTRTFTILPCFEFIPYHDTMSHVEPMWDKYVIDRIELIIIYGN